MKDDARQSTPHVWTMASTSTNGMVSIPGNIVSPDMLKGMQKVYDLNDDPHTTEWFENVNVWLRKKPIPDFLNSAGYFGSPEWWHAIETGFLPVRFIDGVIQFVGLYIVGKRIVLESLEIHFPKEHSLLPSLWQAWLRIWIAVRQ